MLCYRRYIPCYHSAWMPGVRCYKDESMHCFVHHLLIRGNLSIETIVCGTVGLYENLVLSKKRNTWNWCEILQFIFWYNPDTLLVLGNCVSKTMSKKMDYKGMFSLVFHVYNLRFLPAGQSIVFELRYKDKDCHKRISWGINWFLRCSNTKECNEVLPVLQRQLNANLKASFTLFIIPNQYKLLSFC